MALRSRSDNLLIVADEAGLTGVLTFECEDSTRGLKQRGLTTKLLQKELAKINKKSSDLFVENHQNSIMASQSEKICLVCFIVGILALIIASFGLPATARGAVLGVGFTLFFGSMFYCGIARYFNKKSIKITMEQLQEYVNRELNKKYIKYYIEWHLYSHLKEQILVEDRNGFEKKRMKQKWQIQIKCRDRPQPNANNDNVVNEDVKVEIKEEQIEGEGGDGRVTTN